MFSDAVPASRWPAAVFSKGISRMKEVLLSRGLVAFVDDDDFELVSQFKFCAMRRCAGDPKFYARTRTGPKKWVYMHRLVMRVDDKSHPEVDHINGDGLDNRKSNLRLCSHVQNLANRHSSVGVSRFVGVAKQRKKWQAGIRINGTRIHLGVFKNEEDAARAYDLTALKVHGEYAHLNFPK